MENRQTAHGSLVRGLLAAHIGGEPSRIAVIGNAPVAPCSARAAKIDASDLVVRMTSFAVDTDVPRIGTKTDAVVIHRGTLAGPSTFRSHTERLYLLAEPARLYWEREALPAWWPRDLRLVPISNRDVTQPVRRAMGLKRIDVSWPTTGTLAVAAMREAFPRAEIMLTGSSLLESDAPRAFDHQWGGPVSVTPEHRLGAERRLLRSWVSDGWMTVVA